VRQFLSAPLGTPLDAACDPRNGVMNELGSTFSVGPGAVTVNKGWSARWDSPQDLQLNKIDTELNVWLGGIFAFPAIAPRSAIRCTIAHGDTTITITAARLRGQSYRVDAKWEPLIEGQHFYMQLQTRYASQLKDMRAIIESVRFVSDTLHGARIGR
jgi:hypothetical protein